MRRAAKRDQNEGDIRAALHAAGYRTAQISQPGLPDLLVWRKGRPTFLLFEVKDEGGQLTEDQLKFWTDSAGTMRFVVRSPESAVQIATTWIGGNNGGESQSVN